MHGIRVMDRLAQCSAARARGERGAVASIVAVLLGGAVLFGVSAVAVDVGSIMFERRQLQNGADAGSSSLAITCAASATNCSSANTTTMGDVTALNNVNNTRDKVGAIKSVCGTNLPTGANLPACPSTTTGGTDCPQVPSEVVSKALPYVEVRTLTQETNGSNGITNWFSRINGGKAQTTVQACARSAWGPTNPGTLNILPVIMSYCDWQGQTHYDPNNPGNTLLYPPPPTDGASPGYGSAANPWPAGTWEHSVYTKGNPTTCPNWNGHTAPGGFSVIDGSTSCVIASADQNWYHGTTGNSRPCDSTVFGSYLGKIVYIPIFDCMSSQVWPTYQTTDPPGGCNSGSGNNTYYRVMNYAAFYLTGWYFSSDSQPSINPNNPFPGGNPCNGGDRCMSGFFLKDVITGSQLADLLATPSGPTAPNTGLQSVYNIG